MTNASVHSESSEALDLLGLYFRDLSGIEVMGKEEELASAQRIAGLRVAFWRALLGYPALVPALGQLATALLPAQTRPGAALQGLQRAARTVLRSGSSASRVNFEAALGPAAEELGRSDVDGVVSDRALADLLGAEAGKAFESLAARAPSPGDTAFVHYVTAVRRAHHAMVAAKHAFVKANLRLVIAIARRFHRGQMPLQDLIQEGNLGLIKAVDRFDPSRGFRFSTYGSWWIRHTISRAIADKGRTVRLPVHLSDTAGRMTRASREFEKLHGRTPTDDELVVLTGVSVERIERVRKTWIDAPVSLEQPLPEHGGLSLVDAIADSNVQSPAEELDGRRLREHLDEVMTLLAPMEAEILRLRMGSDDAPAQTLQEIGERYALSRERIRQLQEKAIGKLRGEFRRLSLLGA